MNRCLVCRTLPLKHESKVTKRATQPPLTILFVPTPSDPQEILTSQCQIVLIVCQDPETNMSTPSLSPSLSLHYLTLASNPFSHYLSLDLTTWAKATH